MKATDLRIGNFLQASNGSIRVVSEIGQKHYTDLVGQSTLYRDAEPIPLTEEWLLKFGFDYRGYNDDGKIYRVGNKDDVWIQSDDFGYFLQEYKCLDRIKYVHHLQNLYFALTGEELTIK